GYGITLWAFAGYEAPFPEQVEARKWCEVAGVAVLPIPTVDALTTVTRPLVEFNGIEAYWAIKGRRIPLEQAVYEQLRADVYLRRAEFALLPITPEVLEDAERAFDAVLSGELSLAADL